MMSLTAVLCSIRRVMLANSLMYLGEARSALMEAVRARQDVRHALSRKAPEHVRMRIMTSEIFTAIMMSDQTWSECHALMASTAPMATAPPPKTKGESKSKPKSNVRSRSSLQHPLPPQSSIKDAGTQSKGKSSSSFRKKGKKGAPPSSTPTPTVKPLPSSSSKN